MTMQVDTPAYGDWAHDAYTALNDDPSSPDKWPAMAPGQPFLPMFALPPSLASAGSIERYGQVTPPEDRSPAEQHADHDDALADLAKSEALLPSDQMQALQDYQAGPAYPSPVLTDAPASTAAASAPAAPERASKRRRTASAKVADRAGHVTATATAAAPADQPQPAKRKRGRPKSQPQMVDAFTADGFPVQVSSARQSHLEKNRVAAHKCRQRKKEYIGSLEGRAREYAARNKALKENVAMLREELLELKNEVLRHAGCGFWAVDEYLARCAGDVLGMSVPMDAADAHDVHHRMQSPTMVAFQPGTHRAASVDSHPSQHSHSRSAADPLDDAVSPGDAVDAYSGFDLLEDLDEHVDLGGGSGGDDVSLIDVD